MLFFLFFVFYFFCWPEAVQILTQQNLHGGTLVSRKCCRFLILPPRWFTVHEWRTLELCSIATRVFFKWFQPWIGLYLYLYRLCWCCLGVWFYHQAYSQQWPEIQRWGRRCFLKWSSRFIHLCAVKVNVSALSNLGGYRIFYRGRMGGGMATRPPHSVWA